MTQAPQLSTLQRASDGRLSTGSVLDPRTWQREYGPRGAAGLAPACVLIVAFVVQYLTGGPYGWGWSAQTLAEGRIHTLGLHMLAHGGIGHLLMNLGGLIALTAAVMMRFGYGAGAWMRWLILFVLSGLVGALTFLAINPAGVVPMVGASGAICGLWGLTARLDTEHGGLVPLWSRQVWSHVRPFLIGNVVLFAILFTMAWMANAPGGLAWEAHLGGFLTGLLLAPLFTPARPLAAH